MKRKLSTLIDNVKSGKSTNYLKIEKDPTYIAYVFDAGHISIDDPTPYPMIISGEIGVLEIDIEIEQLTIMDCKIGKVIINKDIDNLELDLFGGFINKLEVKKGTNVSLYFKGDIRKEENYKSLKIKTVIIDGEVIENKIAPPVSERIKKLNKDIKKSKLKGEI